ncbi:NAD-dependent epimerase/dehydratase family protein [Deinococcus detaillensis]|uniref:NAD-dependent epimerase/dehydratase family protein n=1 Tax=Deinococcus detaillensis TaxID=2592048 RepID=A0A553UIF1_9DEIO|nr:NAD-dependent epimerase/dehydratase family protein [Deinococcus detaillensis]TSA79936.1 NAD-dependent epimerase/dehydratase family protein [Deinococcus detaillensis]
MQKALVIGLGPLGKRVIKELESRGIEALGSSRSRPAGFTGHWQALDARDSVQVRTCAQDYDLVFLCAAPKLTRWTAEFADLVSGVLKGLAQTSTTLVFASNMYAYGPPSGTLTEQSPEHPVGPKGKLRQHLDRAVLDADQEGDLRTAVVRGSSFYGPQVASSMVGATQIQSMLNGKAVDALGSVDQPHSFTYIDDFARAMVTVALDKDAWGQVWHAPMQQAITLRGFMTALGQPLRIVPRFRVAGLVIVNVMALFNPDMRELKETLYAYTRPFVVSDAKYRAAFNDDATPLAETLRQTMQSLKEPVVDP